MAQDNVNVTQNITALRHARSRLGWGRAILLPSPRAEAVLRLEMCDWGLGVTDGSLGQAEIPWQTSCISGKWITGFLLRHQVEGVEQGKCAWYYSTNSIVPARFSPDSGPSLRA